MTEFQRQLIISLGRQVRSWTEERDQLREHPTDDLKGFCAIATGQLSRLLHQYEVAHTIHICEKGTWCHCFIVVEDHILDVTATQFNELSDVFVLLARFDDERIETLTYYEVTYTFDNADELRVHQKKHKWYKEQICYKGLARMDMVCA